MMQDLLDIRFSKSELNTLVKTKGTCVTLEKKTRVVFLLPSQLSDIKSGIRENLDSHLLKYDYETKAIVIGYEKIKILSKYGSICYGYSKIALRIEANFYLFKPTVGSMLQGIVCKQSGRHLGCLVHKGFNVSIPLEEEDSCGWDFAIGQDIQFTVVKLDLASGPLPYILGKLHLSGAECRRAESVRVVTPEGNEAIVSHPPVDEDSIAAGLDQEGEDGAREPGMGGGARWQGNEEGWGTAEVGIPKEPGGGGGSDGGRDTLISRLLKTVEMSLDEGGEVVAPQKKSGKPKRVSFGLEEGPGAVLGVSAPSPPPSKEPVTSPPSTGGKTKRKKGRGAGGEEDGGDDSGSIIDRLLEMSKRELLGRPQETSRGKKRKSDGGSATSSPAKMMAIKRENDLQPTQHEPLEKAHLPTIRESDEVNRSHASVPSEKSVSSKTSKTNRLSLPSLRGTTKPSLPLKAKRKSLVIKSENSKD